VHTFLTGDESTPANANELAGRETQVEVYGHETPNLPWQRVTNTYVSTAVNGSPTPTAFFNKLDHTTTHLKDGHESTTSYQYNSTYGGVTQVTKDGDANSSSNTDCVKSITSYVARHDTTAYLVLPQTNQTTSCYTSTVEAEQDYFYDGSGSLTATPTAGNLTAARAMTDKALLQADPQKYVYTLNSYYANGTPHEASVPVYGDSTVPQTGNTLGAVWSTKGRTETVYDSASVGRFPSTVTTYVYDQNGNPGVTQTTTYTYDRTLGLPTLVTAPTGLQSSTAYDQFGRPTAKWQTPDTPSFPGTAYVYTWAASNGVNSTRVKNRLVQGASSTVDELHCMDGLGRAEQMIGASGWSFYRLDTAVFDARGLRRNAHSSIYTVSACAPTTNGDGSAPNTFLEYDPLGNVATTTVSAAGTPVACSPSCVRVDHAGLTTTTTDQLNHRKDSTTDGLGRVVSTTEYRGDGSGTPPYTAYAITTYTYDILGNLLGVTDAGSHQTAISYDALGRKQTMSDPDMGSWTYTYNAAGNLLTQTDARGVISSMSYDSLNRLRHKEYSVGASGVPAQTPSDFLYDAYDADTICNGLDGTQAIGHLTVTADGSGATRSCFDIRGREVRKRHLINNVSCGTSSTFDVTTTYDSGNRPVALTYPDGEVVTYGYVDTPKFGAALRSMTSSLGTVYVLNATYQLTGDVRGFNMNSQDTAHTFTSTYTQDSRYRLSGISTTWGTTTLQNLTYGYYENNNIQEINDTVQADDVFYNYDELNRIVDMRQGSRTGTLLSSYGYGLDSDALGGKIGNLVWSSESGNSFSYSSTHIHAPNAGSSTGPISYDANGNIANVNYGTESFVFDVENRLLHSQGGGGFGMQYDYTYDAGGNLVARRASSWLYPGAITPARDVYVDGIYEEHSSACNTPSTMTKFYKAFGRIIAQRSTYSSGSTLSYFLADHLGSTLGTVDAATAAVSRTQYYPFGTQRGGNAPPTDKAYTGQQQESPVVSTIGAYYYHARFYSTKLAHFMSADPRTDDGLNRYAYARNNPANYNDPSGLDAAQDLRDLDAAFKTWGKWGGTLDEFTAGLHLFQQFYDFLTLGQIPVANHALDVHNLEGIARSLGMKDAYQLIATALSKGTAFTDVVGTDLEPSGIARVNVYWRTAGGDYVRITIRMGSGVDSPTHWEIISAQRGVSNSDLAGLVKVGRLEELGRLPPPEIDYDRTPGGPPDGGGGRGGECACGGGGSGVPVPPVFPQPETEPVPVPVEVPGLVPVF